METFVIVHAAYGSERIYGGVVIKDISDALPLVKKILIDKGYDSDF